MSSCGAVTTATAALAVAIVVIPAAYVLYVDHQTSHTTSVQIRAYPRKPDEDVEAVNSLEDDGSTFARGSVESLPATIPAEVRESLQKNDGEWILFHEHTQSNRIAIAETILHGNNTPSPEELDQVLVRFTRGTHSAFSSTPQACLLRTAAKRHQPLWLPTFNATEWIQNLQFHAGDRVNGLWSVAYHGTLTHPPSDGPVSPIHEALVEFTTETPTEPAKPFNTLIVTHARILSVQPTVAELEAHTKAKEETAEEEKRPRRRGLFLSFSNDTYFWRRPASDPLHIVEYTLGRYIHRVTSKWIVTRGLEAVKKQN